MKNNLRTWTDYLQSKVDLSLRNYNIMLDGDMRAKDVFNILKFEVISRILLPLKCLWISPIDLFTVSKVSFRYLEDFKPDDRLESWLEAIEKNQRDLQYSVMQVKAISSSLDLSSLKSWNMRQSSHITIALI